MGTSDGESDPGGSGPADDSGGEPDLGQDPTASSGETPEDTSPSGDEGEALGPPDASTSALSAAIDGSIVAAVESGLDLGSPVGDASGSTESSSVENGWLAAPPKIDPYTRVLATMGGFGAYTRVDTEPYTNVAVSDAEINSFTGTPPSVPFAADGAGSTPNVTPSPAAAPVERDKPRIGLTPAEQADAQAYLEALLAAYPINQQAAQSPLPTPAPPSGPSPAPAAPPPLAPPDKPVIGLTPFEQAIENLRDIQDQLRGVFPSPINQPGAPSPRPTPAPPSAPRPAPAAPPPLAPRPVPETTGLIFDQLNAENARAIAALQAGTGQVPTVDVTQLLENIGPVLNQQERSRAVDAGKRVAQLEKDARDAEDAQIAKELPGTLGSVTPIYGSFQSSRVHVSHGNYVRGVAYGALLISDLFLVKAIVLGGGKLLVRGVAGLLAVAAEDAAPRLGRGAWAGGEAQWGAALRTPAEHDLKLSGFRLAPRPAELAIERVYTPRVLQRAEDVGARDLGHNFPRLLDPIIFSSETRYLTRLGGLGRAGSVTYASEGGFVTLTKSGRGVAESVGFWEIGVLETNSGVERIIHRSFTGNVPVL
jgi:hypothetical protein